MTSAKPCVLTINGGSSSIKFALFEADREPLERILAGRVEGVGLAQASLTVKGIHKDDNFVRPIEAPDHTTIVGLLLDWLQERIERGALTAVGHRVVHGGPKYWKAQRVTPEMVETLDQLSTFDPEHLPEEILLTKAFQERFPDVIQVACFDTAFHYQMPKVAQLLPIPRRYFDKGVRRYGFHGLSCAFLMQQLAQLTDTRTTQGRIILAHLGNGASVTAVRGGESIDTSMSLTPTAGLPMSSRSGDLDPGLGWYLARTEQMSPQEFQHMVNHESGLLGVSEISADMRELLLREAQDVRAAEAVTLFCYQTKKWICALAGALEGLETLVFAGGIGENVPEIRARICAGLEFIGIRLDAALNKANAAVISSTDSKVTVRVIPTDEELIIAQDVYRVLNQTGS